MGPVPTITPVRPGARTTWGPVSRTPPQRQCPLGFRPPPKERLFGQKVGQLESRRRGVVPHLCPARRALAPMSTGRPLPSVPSWPSRITLVVGRGRCGGGARAPRAVPGRHIAPPPCARTRRAGRYARTPPWDSARHGRPLADGREAAQGCPGRYSRRPHALEYPAGQTECPTGGQLLDRFFPDGTTRNFG
jgi:hypothetical protein